ncbi:glycosyltransferase family 4 protein [Pseudalkalibacillus caeni]|uniref:Glycosyltransferase n=1 Tax=Exobacillus caeni TaxID=2574798 RepID=A0A5R9F4P2_9BACL|nr:glycosyltransferase family 4 protein [Pseudalkalibacillus caeni]TLS38682.1 glycosyltransferase [Pseudalkalibacillus caeni]
MKKQVFSLAYGVSLLSSSKTVQNRLFNLALADNSEYLEKPLLLSLACRLGKQRQFINNCNFSPHLGEQYKRYLNAMAYRNLRLYERAWKELEDLPSENSLIVKAKFKTLYDMRDIQGLIDLGHQVSVGGSLIEKQKQHIVEYTFRRMGPVAAKNLCGIFVNEEKDGHFAALQEKYELLESDSRTWEQFLSKYNKSYSLMKKEDVRECIEWLLTLSDLQTELGFVLLVNNASKHAIPFKNIAEYIGPLLEEGRIDRKYIGIDLEYLILAEYAETEKKPNKKLGYLIEAFHEGDRSDLLYNKLIKVLSKSNLRKRNLTELLRMVDEGFLDLSGEDAKKLLIENPGFHRLYSGLHFIGKTDALSEILEIGKKLPIKYYRELVKGIADSLVDYRGPLPFNDQIVSTVSEMLEGYHKWNCLKLRYYIETDDTGTVKNYLASFEQDKQLKLLLYVSKYCYEVKLLTYALHFSEMAYEIDPDNTMVLRSLIRTNHRLGNITDRLTYLEKLKSKAAGRLFGNEYDMAFDEHQLLKEQWEWSGSPVSLEKEDAIIHVLNKSLPQINGYTIRSSEIAEHLKEMGMNPMVVTKLGWSPEDGQTEELAKDVQNGIEHYHMMDQEHQAVLNKIPMSEYFNHYADHFAQLVRDIKPKMIHAASNFQNALPALKVAETYRIPSIYEVRGMWHYTQSSKTPGFENSERYLLHQEYELACCNIADKIVCISESLKEHLINLGIPAEKISFVPNGVDVEKFQPIDPAEKIKKAYDLEGKFVIGFIGSVTPYEGLDYLMKALAKLKEKRSDLRFLLVGDGVELPNLKELAKRLGIEEIVKFVGRVPHDQVKDYYSVVDIFPFPRTKAKVCELVTPLKPYEAMAMEKLVAVSDIPALREMVIDGETGLEFKAEDSSSLADCLEKAVENMHLAVQGRDWVRENRAWNLLAQEYREIYPDVLKADQRKQTAVN